MSVLKGGGFPHTPHPLLWDRVISRHPRTRVFALCIASQEAAEGYLYHSQDTEEAGMGPAREGRSIKPPAMQQRP
jgi:hypothetical protein